MVTQRSVSLKSYRSLIKNISISHSVFPGSIHHGFSLISTLFQSLKVKYEISFNLAGRLLNNQKFLISWILICYQFEKATFEFKNDHEVKNESNSVKGFKSSLLNDFEIDGHFVGRKNARMYPVRLSVTRQLLLHFRDLRTPVIIVSRLFIIILKCLFLRRHSSVSLYENKCVFVLT